MDKFTPGQLKQIRDAAPELLEALRGLVTEIGWDHCGATMEAALDAIAKAAADPSPSPEDKV